MQSGDKHSSGTFSPQPNLNKAEQKSYTVKRDKIRITLTVEKGWLCGNGQKGLHAKSTGPFRTHQQIHTNSYRPYKETEGKTHKFNQEIKTESDRVITCIEECI